MAWRTEMKLAGAAWGARGRAQSELGAPPRWLRRALFRRAGRRGRPLRRRTAPSRAGGAGAPGDGQADRHVGGASQADLSWCCCAVEI